MRPRRARPSAPPPLVGGERPVQRARGPARLLLLCGGMLVQVSTSTVLGVSAIGVDVEVECSGGFPQFSVVGLAGKGVQEAKVRVLAAVRQLGISASDRRITVNLAPADLRKEGTGFDLPMAVALLAACEQTQQAVYSGVHFAGELSLSGEVKPVRGVLPQAIHARSRGARAIVVPADNAREAAVVEGLTVHPVRHFAEVVSWLRGGGDLAAQAPDVSAPDAIDAAVEVDLADIAGQEHAKRALEVAAAGGHNLLMFGPPGSGKTMLARRLPGILPPLSFEEALEATVVHSVAGLTRDRGLLTRRPFRAPHHSISDAGLVGGSTVPRPGEVSLAHHGVLFLDELPEFRRHVIDALRQPLEDGEVCIVRGSRSVTFPSQVMLVAAMNPCPCGHHGDPRRACLCTTHELMRYRRRISGPLLDRIDMHVDVPAAAPRVLARAGQGERSEAVRERVARARALQRQRAGRRGAQCNARLRGAALRRHCAPDDAGRQLLLSAVERLGLSARAHDRILRLARTIADLEGAASIDTQHVAEAIQYRALDRET